MVNRLPDYVNLLCTLLSYIAWNKVPINIRMVFVELIINFQVDEITVCRDLNIK